MVEIFEPRKNMEYVTYDNKHYFWECRDKNGFLVCDGGPSVIYSNGAWVFYISDIGYHRLDGPATNTGRWAFYGTDSTDELYQFAEENDIDLKNLTDEDKILIALKFG